MDARVTLREVAADFRPFRREGMGYVFEPEGVPVTFRFSHVKGKDDPEAEVQILWQGSHHARRRVKLLASGSTGSQASLAKELNQDLNGPNWSKLLRDGCESVLENHRGGVKIERINGRVEPPKPLAWLCKGLLIEGKPNCWLGAGATGKSTFAKTLCVHYAAGVPFLGREIGQGVPLYLDWEDDRESFVRVTSRVCAGLELEQHPEMFYMDMHGRRLADTLEQITGYLTSYQISLVVVDAVASAGGPPGEHSTWESVAVGLEDAFSAMGGVTILAIDHVNADDHRNGRVAVPLKARGAERKYEIFRNQWSLMADEEEREAGRHVVSWHHTKNNAGRYERPFVTEVDYSDDQITMLVSDISRSPDAVERSGSKARVELELAQHPGSPARDLALLAKGDDSRKSVTQTTTELHKLKRQGRARQDEAGRWWPSDTQTPQLQTVHMQL